MESFIVKFFEGEEIHSFDVLAENRLQAIEICIKMMTDKRNKYYDFLMFTYKIECFPD